MRTNLDPKTDRPRIINRELELSRILIPSRLVQRLSMSRNLSLDEVRKILAVAERYSLRDALVFKLIAGYGLSVGEIVGTPNRRWDKQNRKWLPREPVVKGLQIQDLSKEGLLVRRKMGSTD